MKRLSSKLIFSIFRSNPSFAKRFYIMIGRHLSERLRIKNSPNYDPSKDNEINFTMEKSNSPKKRFFSRTRKDDETKNLESDESLHKKFDVPENEIVIKSKYNCFLCLIHFMLIFNQI